MDVEEILDVGLEVGFLAGEGEEGGGCVGGGGRGGGDIGIGRRRWEGLGRGRDGEERLGRVGGGCEPREEGAGEHFVLLLYHFCRGFFGAFEG